MILPHAAKRGAAGYVPRKVAATRLCGVWGTGITCMPGGLPWACRHTVPDAFTREWAGYFPGTGAAAAGAAEAPPGALRRHPGADPAGPAMRTGRGSQHTCRGFNPAIRFRSLKHEYARYKTPQQNGHL